MNILISLFTGKVMHIIIVTVIHCTESYATLAFHKVVVRRFYSGEVGKCTVFYAKFPHDSVHQKLLKWFIFCRVIQNVKGDKQGGLLRHSVFVLITWINPVSDFIIQLSLYR